MGDAESASKGARVTVGFTGITNEAPATAQLRAAIALVSSAAADHGWGTNPDVQACRGGRIQVADVGRLDAAEVFQAARGLIGALLDDLLAVTGANLADVVPPWLTSLAVQEAATSFAIPTDALLA